MIPAGNPTQSTNRHGPRKDSRKQTWLEDKMRRSGHSASSARLHQTKRRTDEDHVDAPKMKKVKTNGPSAKPMQSNQQEDDYILYLERKLGWRTNGSRTKSFGSGLNEDGLDDLAKLVFSSDSDGDMDSDDSYEEWNGFRPSLGTPVSIESRYIPPQMRSISTGDDPSQTEASTKLTKLLKGLLNRLSEQNIASIIDSIEEIYRNNRRHDVTSTLTTLIINGISSHSTHLDSYVVLYAALVASLQRLIGIDFVAFFVQCVVSSYERHLDSNTKDGDLNEERGKEASNLVVLLSELYNFQVLSCILIYDIIRGLLSQPHLTEYNVELLLKVTRSSGLQLRQDDPAALKDIVEIVHAKVAGSKDSFSSRTKFMIEMLTNLKNNKLQKAVGGGASGSGVQDAIDRLKKFLSGMSKKRRVVSHEPLRVTLDDLHSAKTKGKWWLVGAAWNGDPLVEANSERHTAENRYDDGKNEDDKLIKLAKKQGMNTDIRRSIFVVIMSSEDYVDACERLDQLRLTEVQQREIVRVLLHCCGNEKSYNPYHTLICQQLCRTSHPHKITLQFCMWDFLRELGEANVGGIELLKRQEGETKFEGKVVGRRKLRNLAKAYAWWIAKDACTLAILKPIDFTILQSQTQDFLKELLLWTFISSQLTTPVIVANTDTFLAALSRNRSVLEVIFKKVNVVSTLAAGLLYFVSEIFRKDLDADNCGFLGWAIEVVKEVLRASA